MCWIVQEDSTILDDNRLACLLGATLAMRQLAARAMPTASGRHAAKLRCPSGISRRPAPRGGGGVVLGQFSLRFDTGASNWEISAVCAALPLNVNTLPFAEMAT